jgi:polyisoprenoid-binding protein YceI
MSLPGAYVFFLHNYPDLKNKSEPICVFPVGIYQSISVDNVVKEAFMYKRLFMAVLILSIFSVSAFADTWNLDKTHSTISFSVRHLVISKTKGIFNDFAGTVQFDGKDMGKASVEATIQIASIDTDDEKRDEHLRAADFFDAKKYPTMVFKSKKITPGKGDAFTIIGDLTIKDVTKEVALEGEFYGVTDDLWGNTRAGFSAATKINRQDFNVSFNSALQDGSLVVGNDIKIELEIELIKSK